MSGRRLRSDSLTERQRVAKGAGAAISPPSNVPLEREDMPFFASVVAEFARADWTEHQLELAAMLARKMCDMERNQRLFREEGEVLHSPKGTPVQNPRLGVIRALDASILSMRRSLAIDARARGGDKRDIDNRRKAALKTEREAGGVAGGDDLIARN